MIMLLSATLLGSCGSRKEERHERFTVEVINKITPVKNQGSSSLCWAYAMLATIESEHLMQGDSVNLSVDYIARTMLYEQTQNRYLSGGSDMITTRGMAPRLIELLMQNGVMTYDAYHAKCNYNVLTRRLTKMTDQAIAKRTGLEELRRRTADVLDEDIRPLPPHVWLYGVVYTPVEMAHSVCRENEYISLTSFTHKPFFKTVALPLPDNHTGCRFYNVPIDTLVNRVVSSLRHGHCVCWEGDASEPGFSFSHGTARLNSYNGKGRKNGDVTQQSRQREFESFKTTDDHSMEIIGIARDSRNRRCFICKNSWGEDNPYHGLMFMDEDYFRMKTVAVVMKNERSRN